MLALTFVVWLLLIFLIRKLEGSWTSPGVVFTSLWIVFAGVSVLSYPQVPEGAWLRGLGFIMLCCVAVHVGTLVAAPVAAYMPLRIRRPKPEVFNHLFPIGIVIVILAIGYFAVLFQRQGVNTVDTEAVMEVSANNRINYGYGDQKQGPIEIVLYIIIYLGAAFGGVIAASNKSFLPRIVAVLLLVAAAVLGMLFGSRMGILFGGGLFLGAFFSARLLTGGPVRSLQGLVYPVVLSGVIFVISVVIIFIRYKGEMDSFQSIDGLGFPAAFSMWFDEFGTRSSEIPPGYRMFSRLFRFFGYQYPDEEVVWIGRHASFNIYTVFRSLIEDFGISGCLLFLVITGFVGRIAYHKVRRGSVIAAVPLTVVYAFTVTSATVSMFMYNVINAALILFGLYCAYVSSRLRGVPEASEREDLKEDPGIGMSGADAGQRI